MKVDMCADGQNRSPAHLRSWTPSYRTLFPFVLKFTAYILGFCLLSLLPIYDRAISTLVLLDARLADRLLQFAGLPSRVLESTVWSSTYAITVLPACAGDQFFWFFAATVLAFPVRVAYKTLGLVGGAGILLILGLARVTSLCFIGMHFPRWFETAHEEIWEVLLVLASVGLAAGWGKWAIYKDSANAVVAR